MIKRLPRFSLRAFAVLLLFSTTVIAEVNFNGFASFRGVLADSDGGAAPFGEYRGSGDITFQDNTLIALQASSYLDDGLSATVQFVAEGQSDFDVEAFWAYLTYELNDTHRLSVGRFANPIFHQSQYEKVGYAHNYARLPIAVYGNFTFNTTEGISLDSLFNVGDHTLETKVQFSRWNGLEEDGFGLTNMLALNATYSGDWWKFFGGYIVAEFDGGTGNANGLDTAFTGVAAAGVAAAGLTDAQAAPLYEVIANDGRDAIYWFVGGGLDYNNILFDLEYVEYYIDGGSSAETQAYYAALGYRFGDMVVTGHYEKMERDPQFGYLSGLSNQALIAIGRATTQFFYDVQDRPFDAVGIDVRYDFHPSAALKIGVVNGENENPAIGDYTITSIGVDLLF